MGRLLFLDAFALSSLKAGDAFAIIDVASATETALRICMNVDVLLEVLFFFLLANHALTHS